MLSVNRFGVLDFAFDCVLLFGVVGALLLLCWVGSWGCCLLAVYMVVQGCWRVLLLGVFVVYLILIGCVVFASCLRYFLLCLSIVACYVVCVVALVVML